MTKDNILFGIVGLLAGLIIGFMFANSVNKGAVGMTSAAPTSVTQQGPLPPGHPEIQSGPGGQQSMGASAPEVQAAIDKAKNEPDNFDAQVRAAELYYQIQRFDGAIDFLKRANQLKPDDYDVIVHLGNANFDAAENDASKYSEAEKWYTLALSKKPEDVSVRTDLGLVFMFREPANYDRAIQEFKRSLEYNPNHPQTLQNLTVAYTKKGDAASASATLAKLEASDKNNPAVAKLRTDIDALKNK
jgi:tetratricopeptide (TPR) repeat protein